MTAHTAPPGDQAASTQETAIYQVQPGPGTVLCKIRPSALLLGQVCRSPSCMREAGEEEPVQRGRRTEVQVQLCRVRHGHAAKGRQREQG